MSDRSREKDLERAHAGHERSRGATPTFASTVLVVDDVPYMLELATLFLARTALVRTALGGQAGLDAVRELHPALVLCDDFMPAIDGHELCRAIRQDPQLCTIPVVLMMSDPGARAHGAAIRSGADDVIAKPLERMSLVETVSRFLGPTRVRALPRIDMDLPVTLVSQEIEGSGIVKNVSRGGAFVETALPLRCADEVSLRFELPGSGRTLEPSARVIWRRNRYASRPTPDGAGLRFVEIDADSARALDEFVYERTAAASLEGAVR